MKVYLSKNLLTELRGKYSYKIECIKGLEDVDSLSDRMEYEVIINLIDRQLASLPKEEKKKEYAQLYYLKNKKKLKKRYCDRAKEMREKSKLYDEIIRNGKIN